jgi:hypothetical protein
MNDSLKQQQLQKMAQTLLAHGAKLSDEDLQQIQLKTDALEKAKIGGHHDHDHPSILSPSTKNVLPS